MVGQSPLSPELLAVPLEPFVHQVGGHTSMLRYDEHTVCKPLVSQELSFYESLPWAMRQFTPQYKGVVSVHLKKDSLGNLTLVASPGTEHGLVKRSHTQGTKTFRDSCSGKVLLRTDLQYHTDSLLEDANGNQPERKSYNPWGLHCHRQHLNRMSSKHNENKLHRILSPPSPPAQSWLQITAWNQCMVYCRGTLCTDSGKMQNVLCHFLPLLKKKKKKKKPSSHKEFSAEAFPLSPLQVYQADTGHFLCKDKYFGRKLSPEGFRQTLRQFLSPGNQLRTDLLEPIILRLKALLSVIRKQSSYRFYSSSLLIIYDGQEPKESAAPLDHHLPLPKTHGANPARVDVRMIDFAHTTFKGSKSSPTPYDGPDHGYIFGLENLIKILQSLSEGK
ncbi:PREDICTED: inositol hexakisphosphate kinase 3 [Lepidothrix coronata]|uniref:Kinase n=1 Tax=Lepidothrix coronata TaxID=321398 RepID=A0A6J0IX32_9PASS|nr:PREDICTED: inositol hexakisphosphate kinase 3 [Lepidothrix coronata]